ncbi:hypothetical protein H7W66_000859 [Campylobacter coli]|uniref:Uncharacterized protein n=2 Tax=Helicobacter pullorum TaxID=35818 RepID=A0A0N1MRQ8_9HELI|nr:hypothetical protein [Helicobacter pullorum]EAI7507376.1 hypothetical protein [Campylobacter coli]EAK6385632.1 hypothetical protein [Campylobacter coli]EDO9587759.1 hypothetical protein [Campylobacter coli]EEQ62620.1 hypothetical protein HPMG_00077 [Helicobacter pullorum MIT 98-5489]EFB7095148.1 hypothetical protein [Campylobacter coli]
MEEARIVSKIESRILKHFGKDELEIYNTFSRKMRASYAMYIGTTKRKPIMSPKSWESARVFKEDLTSFKEISESLKLDMRAVIKCYRSGIKKIKERLEAEAVLD